MRLGLDSAASAETMYMGISVDGGWFLAARSPDLVPTYCGCFPFIHLGCSTGLRRGLPRRSLPRRYRQGDKCPRARQSAHHVEECHAQRGGRRQIQREGEHRCHLGRRFLVGKTVFRMRRCRTGLRVMVKERTCVGRGSADGSELSDDCVQSGCLRRRGREGDAVQLTARAWLARVRWEGSREPAYRD